RGRFIAALPAARSGLTPGLWLRKKKTIAQKYKAAQTHQQNPANPPETGRKSTPGPHPHPPTTQRHYPAIMTPTATRPPATRKATHSNHKPQGQDQTRSP